MDKRDKKIRQLENERNQLMAENQELKYIINDIQSVNDIMREDIEKECAAECGCIVIEGSRTSAAYQDLVGILLANNYSVEVIPMDERRKLKIVIRKVRYKSMVNERQGKVYNPRPVYNRKLLRSVIRAGVQKQFGQHHVSANMAGNFEKIRKEQVK